MWGRWWWRWCWGCEGEFSINCRLWFYSEAVLHHTHTHARTHARTHAHVRACAVLHAGVLWSGPSHKGVCQCTADTAEPCPGQCTASGFFLVLSYALFLPPFLSFFLSLLCSLVLALSLSLALFLSITLSFSYYFPPLIRSLYHHLFIFLFFSCLPIGLVLCFSLCPPCNSVSLLALSCISPSVRPVTLSHYWPCLVFLPLSAL